MNESFAIRLRQPEAGTGLTMAAPHAFVTEIAEPELHVFPAARKKNTGIAAIICPGGGYRGLALGAEGHFCAEYLASVGITGMVLQYRLPFGDKTIPMEDIHAAMAYARVHAEELGFSPDRLGVIGFSAGGHLAALASSLYADDPVSTRPDFTVLFYPVTSMEKRKRGSTRLNFLGRRPSEQDVAAYSPHLRVTETTPPTLIFAADDDPQVPSRHSVLYYEALKQNNIPASLHIFPAGGHAWGFCDANSDGVPFRYGKTVRELILDWMLRVTAS